MSNSPNPIPAPVPVPIPILTTDELLAFLHSYCELNKLVCFSRGQQVMQMEGKTYVVMEMWIPCEAENKS